MSDWQFGPRRKRREVENGTLVVKERTIPRRMLNDLQDLLTDLQHEGLTWVSVQDVAGHLSATAAWQRGELPLIDLCAEAGWPMPSSAGKDFTTPAAMAVFRAKERLAEAMLADHHEGAGANTIAARAANAYSRPVALKVLAGVRLLEDATTVLVPWFEAEVPVFLSQPKDRSVRMTASWDDEDEATRRRQLQGIDAAFTQAGLSLRDPETQQPRTTDALVSDDRRELEVYRSDG
ncbi:hypothetical protein [Streptomyces sp. XH2]|uniref:hypothetical protein n=1 Tax=Streptomyces sp. XH2 TaxID=3412483 RepID=UPI003C79869E